jgi:hypothetical protein
MSSDRSRSGGRRRGTTERPVVEVLAELALLDHLRAGRGWSRRRAARSRADRPMRAEPLDWRASRGNGGSFTWCRGVDLADLVTGRACRRPADSKRPTRRSLALGERALLVAEELRYSRRLPDGGAVHRHEGPFGALARLVDHLGEELSPVPVSLRRRTVALDGATERTCSTRTAASAAEEPTTSPSANLRSRRACGARRPPSRSSGP